MRGSCLGRCCPLAVHLFFTPPTHPLQLRSLRLTLRTLRTLCALAPHPPPLPPLFFGQALAFAVLDAAAIKVLNLGMAVFFCSYVVVWWALSSSLGTSALVVASIVNMSGRVVGSWVLTQRHMRRFGVPMPPVWQVGGAPPVLRLFFVYPLAPCVNACGLLLGGQLAVRLQQACDGTSAYPLCDFALLVVRVWVCGRGPRVCTVV